MPVKDAPSKSNSGYYQCPKCKSILLVEYPEPIVRAKRLKASPRTKAGISRTVKTIIFYIIGFVLAVAAFAVVGILSDTAVPEWLVQITGLVVAGISAGIYKVINWKDTGVNLAALPAPTATPDLPQLQPPELPKGEGEENVNN